MFSSGKDAGLQGIDLVAGIFIAHEPWILEKEATLF